MPRTISGDKRRDEQVAAALAAREEFEAEFRRSARGNLWCYDEAGFGRLLVFQKGSRWGWLITDGEEKEYSPEDYATESDALGSLWNRLYGCG